MDSKRSTSHHSTSRHPTSQSTASRPPTPQLPTLDPGLTYLDDADAPTALYRLVGRQLAASEGPAYWLDARNAASTVAIREHARGRSCRSLRVARAFTGYQHYELVRSLPGEVSPRTALVVAPNLGALYADDDVPGYEADAMFEATLALLAAVAEAVDAPVLVTASARGEEVRAAADRTLAAERTRAGLRFEGPSFCTDVYWHDWGFQTTIPYWVELFGAADAFEIGGTVGVGETGDAPATIEQVPLEV